MTFTICGSANHSQCEIWNYSALDWPAREERMMPTISPYNASASAKMRIRIIPTKSFGCWAFALQKTVTNKSNSIHCKLATLKNIFTKPVRTDIICNWVSKSRDEMHESPSTPIQTITTKQNYTHIWINISQHVQFSHNISGNWQHIWINMFTRWNVVWPQVLSLP